MTADGAPINDASIGVIYGEYRLRIAKWAGKSPADVTVEDAGKYELACEEEGHQP